MKVRFCQYCGVALEEKYECLRELAQAKEDQIEELESRPETQYGWYRQDVIENGYFHQR